MKTKTKFHHIFLYASLALFLIITLIALFLTIKAQQMPPIKTIQIEMQTTPQNISSYPTPTSHPVSTDPTPTLFHLTPPNNL